MWSILHAYCVFLYWSILCVLDYVSVLELSHFQLDWKSSDGKNLVSFSPFGNISFIWNILHNFKCIRVYVKCIREGLMIELMKTDFQPREHELEGQGL